MCGVAEGHRGNPPSPRAGETEMLVCFTLPLAGDISSGPWVCSHSPQPAAPLLMFIPARVSPVSMLTWLYPAIPSQQYPGDHTLQKLCLVCPQLPPPPAVPCCEPRPRQHLWAGAVHLPSHSQPRAAPSPSANRFFTFSWLLRVFRSRAVTRAPKCSFHWEPTVE